MKVLIFGAKGALGQDLADAFGAAGHDVVGLDREELDVTVEDAVRRAVADARPSLVVNAAAWNDVDGAEDPARRHLAFAVNGRAPGVMAEAARDAGATFVHFSTDYVFAGDRPEGYREDDEPSPVSAYGESKLEGERAVRAAGGKSYVCRLSKLFGRPGSSPSAKPSFVNVMRRLAAERPELTIVDEEVGMPTYTKDIAEAVVRLVSGGYAAGVYHIVNEGPGVTWYGFAEEFLPMLGLRTPRRPVPSSAFPKPAKRPLHAKLLNTKFPPLRPRTEALRAFFAEYPPAAEKAEG